MRRELILVCLILMVGFVIASCGINVGEPAESGKYELKIATSNAGDPIAWRLNKGTGEVLLFRASYEGGTATLTRVAEPAVEKKK